MSDATAPENEEIITVANKAIHAATEVLNQRFRGRMRASKSGAHDLKLDVDRQTETAIRDVITAHFPHHVIVGEEYGGQMSATEKKEENENVDDAEAPCNKETTYEWHVDPLDGTVNFYHGIPYFCTSIACFARAHNNTSAASLGEPVAAVIAAPALNEHFSLAADGTPLYNGKAMPPLPVRQIQNVMVATSFGSNRTAKNVFKDVNEALIRHARKVRVLGATALDTAYVGAGRIGGIYQYGIYSWDFAAGMALAKACGAQIMYRPCRLKERWELLVAFPGVFADMKELILGV